MKPFAVFDLDGTLLDTLEDLADACNIALLKEGFPVHPVEPYRFFVGDGVGNLIRRAVPENSRDEQTLARVKAHFDVHYAAHSRDKTKPYPEIPEALHALRQAGFALAVLSNKPDAYAGELVELYFPGLFDLTFGQREGVPLKPDPAAVREIMKLLAVEPQDGFYIGDTGTDMETGKRSQLYTIGASWGFRTTDELLSAGADSIVNKAAQLPKIMLDNLA
jgi:phosphoglycolate phosphatase